MLAAVTSAVLTQSLSGTQPAFRVPEYAFHTAAELPFYLGLGLLAGPLAAFYIGALCERLTEQVRLGGGVITEASVAQAFALETLWQNGRIGIGSFSSITGTNSAL